jgi:ClpP class serine protease
VIIRPIVISGAERPRAPRQESELQINLGALPIAYFILVSLQPLVQQRTLEMMRRRKISAIERARGSRVILLAHRQETMRLLGFPMIQHINMNDTAEIIHAIRMTSGVWTQDDGIAAGERSR